MKRGQEEECSKMVVHRIRNHEKEFTMKKNDTSVGRKPGSDKSGQKRGAASHFLRRKEWVVAGVLVALASLFVVFFGLGTSDPATQAASANRGNVIIQGGKSKNGSINIVEPSPPASPSQGTPAETHATACLALKRSAVDEAMELTILKGTISVDAPTSRVTGSTPEFSSSYTQTMQLMRAINDNEAAFEDDGETISADPRLDGDLGAMGGVLPSLRQAVLDKGVGGDQWNQLTDYAHDFRLLRTLKCSR
jgi:hypothetical protein